MKGVKGFKKGHKHSQETKNKISKALSNKVVFNCDMCGIESSDKPSSYNRKKRHFCGKDCYAKFRSERMDFYEQNSYKGIRSKSDSKQIYHRRFCKNNKELISHLKARRYARERGADGKHTLDEWVKLKESFNNVCAYCGSDEKMTKDHIIPLSKGGSDFISNIQPLCKSCNSKKHNHIHQNPELLEQK